MKEFNLQSIIRENILKMKPYSCARDEFKGEDGIFLDANENPFGDLNRYPDPYQSKLKQKLSRLKGFPEQGIFAGNGSDEVIDLTLRIFCNPGKDKILIFPPTYGMYKVCAEINDIETVEIPLNSDFQLDLQKITPILNDELLKVIFICSPNNPTGNLIKYSDIEFIINNFSGIVFVDEAYIDFSGTQSLIYKIESHPNLFVSQTFSKSRALASARVGIAYASPEIVGYYNKVKQPYNISKQNQKAAIDALENNEIYEQRKEIILEGKRKLQTELLKIASVIKIYPSDTNFLLVEFNDANRIYSELITRKIITRNRNSVINNCIRITVGTPEETATLIDALHEL